MTVASQYHRERFKGDGDTRVFPFCFQVYPSLYPEKYVFVEIFDKDGAIRELSPDSFEIKFNKDLDGGTVTYPRNLYEAPLPVGSVLVVYRSTPVTQEMDFNNQGKFFPNMIESGLDKLTFIMQELWFNFWDLEQRLMDWIIELLKDKKGDKGDPGTPGKNANPLIAVGLIRANGWVGDVIPYVQRIDVTGVRAISMVIVRPVCEASVAEIVSYQDLILHDGCQGDGFIKLKALGTLNSIDIPVTIAVWEADELVVPPVEPPPVEPPPPVVPVTGISLSPKSMVLSLDEPGGGGIVPPDIVPAVLPNGRVGAGYNFTILASGSPAVFSVYSGALPHGLSLSSSGAISGMPSEAGASNFTVLAFNAVGSDTETFGIIVDFADLPDPEIVLVTGISIIEAADGVIELNLEKPGIQLTALITPSNATNNGISWSSSNDLGIMVNENGYVLMNEPANGVNYIIRATAQDGSGVFGEAIIRGYKPHVRFNSNMANIGHLTITVIPQNASNTNVSLVSSNPGVASVDQNGIVIPKAPGSTFIIVHTQDGGFSDSCSVSVVSGGTPPPVYDISLNPSADKNFGSVSEGYGAQAAHSVTISNIGDKPTGALTIVLSGANASSFTLDKSTITNINAGGSNSFTVAPKMGLAAGTYNAIVTVSGNAISAHSFYISFTVLSVVIVTGISISEAADGVINLDTNNTSIQLTPVISPSNASNKGVTWSSSEPNVLDVDQNGFVQMNTPIEAVLFYIRATALDGSGVFGEASFLCWQGCFVKQQ